MKKKLLSLTLALTLGLSALPVAAEEAEAEPERKTDPEGTISFELLDDRVLNDGLNGRALTEGIAATESLNYADIAKSMVPALNGLATAQWAAGNGLGWDSYIASSLEQQAIALRSRYESFRDGDIERDTKKAKRQLEDTRDQLLLGAETLFLNILEIEAGLDTMNRGLNTLGRTVEEMELRHSLGQISDLTLEQIIAQRTALASQKKTLEMNLAVAKLNLEQMAGAPLTGNISLTPPPELSPEVTDRMDLEKDLTAAKERSYALYAADQTLRDGRREFMKYENYNNSLSDSYTLYVQAEHQWKAAQLKYESDVASYEIKFRVLYLQVKNYRQVWEAARAALATEELNYDAAQLKFRQGELSESKLADALDTVDAARDKVNTAYRNFFTSWNNYRWAVDHGVLN